MPSFDGPLLTTADMSRKGEFEVEEVRAVRYDSGTGEKHCLIKWKDFDEEHTSWEPIDHATHAKAAVKQGTAVSKWTWEFFLKEPSLKPPARTTGKRAKTQRLRGETKDLNMYDLRARHSAFYPPSLPRVLSQLPSPPNSQGCFVASSKGLMIS